MAELSGLEVAGLVKEINARLRGTYVNNVYSLGDSHLIRFRGQAGEDAVLVASPTRGVWISEKASERVETTRFVSKLRAQVARSQFSGASQYGTDRIVDIALGEGERERHLVVEQMPPGNTIVTDGSRRVLLAQREVRTPGRRVTEGAPYSEPAQRRADPELLTAEDLASLLSKEPTLGRAFGRGVALPRKYVSELLHRLRVSAGQPPAALAGREEEAAEVIRGMVASAREDSGPCVCETEEGDEIFAILPEAFAVKERGPSLSVLCDELILPELVAEAEGEAHGPSQGEAALRRLKDQADSKLAEAAALRSLALSVRDAPTMEEAARLAGSRARGPASQAALASAIFDGAKELESEAGELRSAARRLERKSRSAKAQEPKLKPLSRTRGEWFEKFRWFRTSGGRLAIGGRDAQTNSLLVRRHLEEGDTVYHADLFGSPFFVLKDGREQTEEEVTEVAQATVSFSSAWKTGLASADAYWIYKDQVKTSAPSGEYLARGSFLIAGKKNPVPRNQVRLAVGLSEDGRVVSGPEGAVSRSASAYVVLVPHREKASDTAKKVARELELSSGASMAGRLDEVMRALPAGGGKLVPRSRAVSDKL